MLLKQMLLSKKRVCEAHSRKDPAALKEYVLWTKLILWFGKINIKSRAGINAGLNLNSNSAA